MAAAAFLAPFGEQNPVPDVVPSLARRGGDLVLTEPGKWLGRNGCCSFARACEGSALCKQTIMQRG